MLLLAPFRKINFFKRQPHTIFFTVDSTFKQTGLRIPLCNLTDLLLIDKRKKIVRMNQFKAIYRLVLFIIQVLKPSPSHLIFSYLEYRFQIS